jgi:hypothetical protein
VVENHPRNKTDWGEYFASIKQQCPWSYIAWQQGQIDIVEWDGNIIPLNDMQARVYVAHDADVEAIAKELDVGEYEWLFSYPGYGQFATPEKVLIQQLRTKLTELRSKHEYKTRPVCQHQRQT